MGGVELPAGAGRSTGSGCASRGVEGALRGQVVHSSKSRFPEPCRWRVPPAVRS